MTRHRDPIQIYYDVLTHVLKGTKLLHIINYSVFNAHKEMRFFDTLESNGIIEFTNNKTKVHITPKGKKFYDKIKALMDMTPEFYYL